ncbi:MAG: hypothetical protein AB8B91_14645 [Rubripirellula sp.]
MDKPELKVAEGEIVPAFTCLVYVWQESGKTLGRVANLGGIEASGGSERDVLGKIVPAFKARVASLVQSGDSIPWIESPSPPTAGQQKRIVPVHL